MNLEPFQRPRIYARALVYAMLVLTLGAGRDAAVTPPMAGFPPLQVPEDGPLTRARIELGRELFFERRLSADGKVSCGDCHKPSLSFSDSVAVSTGAFGRHGFRKTMSLLNVGYQTALMWDGRAPDLEKQVRLPLNGENELAMQDAGAVQAVAGNPEYAQLFASAFGDPAISIDRIAQAIAAFERTIIAGDAPFDRFYFRHDRQAMSASAIRGWEIFQAKGCIDCHRFEAGNPLFADFDFHNTGIGFDRLKPDLGRFYQTMVSADQGKFRTPGLRGVADRAPYMHDGQLATLRDVIDYYDKGGNPNRFLDQRIKPLRLNESEKDDLIAFLRALSSGSGPRTQE